MPSESDMIGHGFPTCHFHELNLHPPDGLFSKGVHNKWESSVTCIGMQDIILHYTGTCPHEKQASDQ